MHPRLRPVLWLIPLLLIGILVRFWGLGHQGFWYDEADTVLLLHLRAGGMLGLLPRSESTPPLYYCVAWVWSRVFGDDAAGLRSLSALAGVLVIPALFTAARRLGGSGTVALAAAALAATSPLLIWYSQEARAYSLLVLFSSLLWIPFAELLVLLRRRWLIVWTGLGALALCTHYYAVLVLAPQAVVLLWRWCRRREMWLALGALGIVGCALLPLLLTQDHAGNARWIHQIALGHRVGQVFPQFVAGPDAPGQTILEIVGVALALGALLGLTRPGGGPARSGRFRPERPGHDPAGSGRLVAGLTLGGFGLSLLFVLAGSDTLLTRNLIGLWPGAALAVAFGVGELAAVTGRAVRRTLATVCVLGLCLVGLVAVVGVQRDAAYQRPDWRPLAAWLNRRSAGGDRLVLIQHYSESLPLTLLVPRLGYARGSTDPDVDQVDVVAFTGSPGDPPCWWGAGCNLVPSVLQRAYEINGFRPVAHFQVRQFRVLELAARRPETVTRRALAAALTTTTLRHDVLLMAPPGRA